MSVYLADNQTLMCVIEGLKEKRLVKQFVYPVCLTDCVGLQFSRLKAEDFGYID